MREAANVTAICESIVYNLFMICVLNIAHFLTTENIVTLRNFEIISAELTASEMYQWKLSEI